MTTEEARLFEDEVRRVARALWPSAEYSGAVMLDAKERDGVFETEETINVLECTTSALKAKAEADVKKLRAAIGRLRKPDKPAIGWFITKNEPTADQRSVLKGSDSIKMASLRQFKSRLIDSMSYLDMRKDHAFGSVRDPVSGGLNANLPYIPLGITADGTTPMNIDVPGLARQLQSGRRVLLLGDYGAGKSMTVREVFRVLSDQSKRDPSLRFPIHLNLRDHQGQVDPTEVLERHARLLGFPHPSQLVRAWRAGHANLLLDGFDEIATLSWAGVPTALRSFRQRSVEVIRRFVAESPTDTGILIAGRQHFFDNAEEMHRAFGLGNDFTNAHLDEFSEEDITQYLHQLSWRGPVPEWVPGKPLLLTYLAKRGLLASVLDIPEGSAPAAAWDNLLDRICEREALIEAGIDAQSVRGILERLASFARRSSNGVGPIPFAEVSRAFREVVGYPPDEKSTVLLQRLPGLGAPDGVDQTRSFVDESLVDAARAGDVVAWVRNPYDDFNPTDHDWVEMLGVLGVEVAVLRIGKEPELIAKCHVSIERLSRMAGTHSPLLGDLVRVLGELENAQAPNCTVLVEDVNLPMFAQSETVNLGMVEFRSCLIDLVQLSRDAERDARLPYFKNCLIDVLEGRVGSEDLPEGHFVDCEIELYLDNNETVGGILASTLPRGNRVVMTILKKIYRQRGSGRKEGALVRGLDQSDRGLVRKALTLLLQEGLTTPTKSGKETIWIPLRNQRQRVSRILDAPTKSRDTVITESASW